MKNRWIDGQFLEKDNCLVVVRWINNRRIDRYMDGWLDGQLEVEVVGW